LAEHFLTQGYRLKISTTSPHRLPTLAALPAEACIVDIGKPLDDIDAFLQSDTLIVNITSKDIEGEESPDHPLVIIENMFRQSVQFQTTIVRFAGLIGGSRHPGRFFRGGKLVKNPDANVNLIHRDDCINILDRIVANGLWGETFNACADSHPSKREFYTQAAKMVGAPLPEFEDSGDHSFKIIDNRKLKRVLDYEFMHPDLMAIRFDED
jgi:hypothetical protein